MSSFVSTNATLSAAEVERFSRQMIVEGMSPAAMERILHAHVACIGLGGLGSTAALYLTAGGVGTLTFIDPDLVDASNLHRQVIHTDRTVGQYKVHSAREACLALRPSVTIHAVPQTLAANNAEALLSTCDVLVDCSDNIATRYLANDIAVYLDKPLVSGAAVRWDGQLSVYHYAGGPCYRCLHPRAPPASAVGNCSDVGVMGPVPGMIGCLQALETLKILAGKGCKEEDGEEVLSGRMFVFDGLRLRSRVVRLRGRQDACLVCGKEGWRRSAGGVPFAELAKEQTEYSGNQGGCPSACTSCAANVRASSDVSHCTPAAMAAAMTAAAQPSHIITDDKEDGVPLSVCVDVRAAGQYDMAHLPYAHSLPLAELQRWQREGTGPQAWSQFLAHVLPNDDARRDNNNNNSAHDDARKEAMTTTTRRTPCNVYLICRRGVASLQALELLQAIEAARHDESTADGAMQVRLINVDGGLNAYHKEVDHGFPYY